MQSMTQASAQQRLERALKSKTRLAIEQLELQPGDLIDFWRKPGTKDESGWRGPATILTPGPTTATVKWLGQNVNVRTQDLRRSLVYMASLPRCFIAEDRDDPWALLVAFAESLPGTHLRIGWIQVPNGKSSGNDTAANRSTGQPVARFYAARPSQWKKTKSSDEHYQMLMALLHVAAHGLQLPACIGGRIGSGVAHLESVKEAENSVLIWWRTGSDFTKSSHEEFHYECAASCRLSLPGIMSEQANSDHWRKSSFVQFITAKDDDMTTIMRQEPSVPNLGGQFPKRPPDDPKTPGQPGDDAPRPPRPPPRPPGNNPGGTTQLETTTPRPPQSHPSAEDAAMAPLPFSDPPSPPSSRSRSRSRNGDSESEGPERVSPSLSPSRPASRADSTRSRSPRPPRVRPQPSPQDNKRERPASSTSRGGARRRRTEEEEGGVTAGLSPSLGQDNGYKPE